MPLRSEMITIAGKKAIGSGQVGGFAGGCMYSMSQGKLCEKDVTRYKEREGCVSQVVT